MNRARRRTKQTGADAQKAGVERALDQLAAAISRFRIDAQRYFAGDIKIPPEDLRDQIQDRIRKLRTQRYGVADGFRLTTLESQFNSHLDLFGRRLRDRERGVGKMPVTEARPDPKDGVTLGERGTSNAVELLYQGLYSASSRSSPKMDLERFRSYLGKQVETIRAKTGCRNIEFRVVEESGKLKLKARPVKS